MRFVSNRDITVATNLGHVIKFVKDEPVSVPRALHTLVMEKGILPVKEDTAAVQDLASEEKKPVLAPEDQGERDDAIEKVIRAIVSRNNSKDFTGGGTPAASAVSTALGWRADQKEVRKVWEKLRPELIGNGAGE